MRVRVGGGGVSAGGAGGPVLGAGLASSASGRCGDAVVAGVWGVDQVLDRSTTPTGAGLTPILHTNMTPYGEIQLHTDRRLDLTGLPASVR